MQKACFTKHDAQESSPNNLETWMQDLWAPGFGKHVPKTIKQKKFLKRNFQCFISMFYIYI